MSVESTEVAVIIPIYRDYTALKSCVCSLSGQINSKIFAVDNTESERRQKPEFLPEGSFYTKTKKNIGFGAACNMGFRAAVEEGFRYFLFLNQDTVLLPDSLYGLVKTASEIDEKLFVVAPLIISENGLLEANFESNLVQQCKKLFVDALIAGKVSKTYSVDFIPAACWLVSYELLCRTGGFDEIFFIYGEDDDFCARTKYLSGNVFLLTTVVVKHYRSYGEYENNFHARARKAMHMQFGRFVNSVRWTSRGSLSAVGHAFAGLLRSMLSSILNFRLDQFVGQSLAIPRLLYCFTKIRIKNSGCD